MRQDFKKWLRFGLLPRKAGDRFSVITNSCIFLIQRH